MKKELELLNEQGLNPAQLKQAHELATLAPQVVKEATAIAQLEVKRGEKYYALCVELRKPVVFITPGEGGKGVERKMNRREVTILLQSLGFPKQRVTEVNRVIECPDDVWAKFEAKFIPFKEALKLTRGTPDKAPDADAGAAGGEGEGEGEAKAAKPIKPTEVTNGFTDKAKDSMVAYLMRYRKAFPIHADAYKFVYTNEDKQQFTVIIFADLAK